MKKYIPLSLLLILITSAVVQAQIHIGMTTAVNSTFVLDKGLKADENYLAKGTYQMSPIGFNFGADFGRIGLSLESILSNQGQVFEIINAAKDAVGERKIDMQYIQIPLLFKLNGKNKGIARGGFQFGPQLSLLRKGAESLIVNDPSALTDGTLEEIIGGEIPNLEDLNPGVGVDPLTGDYELPTDVSIDLLTTEATNEVNKFRDKEVSISMAFGIDVDLGKHLYFSSNVKANYSLTDARTGDLIDSFSNGGGVKELLERRANLQVGAQLGLHYVIGGTKSFRKKQKEDKQ